MSLERLEQQLQVRLAFPGMIIADAYMHIRVIPALDLTPIATAPSHLCCSLIVTCRLQCFQRAARSHCK